MAIFNPISESLFNSISAASTFMSFTPVADNIRFVRASDRHQTFNYSFFLIKKDNSVIVLEIINKRLTEKEYLSELNKLESVLEY